MTGANMKLVTVNVKLDEGDEDPQQHLDQVISLLSTPPSIGLKAKLKV
jgi:hypothetical protein